MNIDQLPVEILIKIFGYLPTFAEVSLVNRLFYDIACKVNDPNICLRINQSFYQRFLCDNVTSSQFMHSIQTSNRQISKIEVGPFGNVVNRDQRQIILVLQKFTTAIKCLKYTKSFMSESTFLEILSLVPNVEHLDLYDLYFGKDEIDDEVLEVRQNGDLNLRKLKLLSIAGCDEEFAGVLKRLPFGGLTELQISGFDWNTLADLLNRQLNIKVLKLGFIRGNGGIVTDIFEKIHLHSLVLTGNKVNSQIIAAILSKQTKLKSLELSKHKGFGDTAMDAITNLLAMESLTMNGSEVSISSFGNIRKLKNLKYLRLTCNDSETTDKLKIFAESEHASMEELTLSGYFEVSADLVTALPTSVPHLKYLTVSTKLPMRSAALNEILVQFNSIEILDVFTWDEPVPNQCNYFNPKLRELTISSRGSLSKPFLTKLGGAYPNLRKLELTPFDFTVVTVEILPILEAFVKLESLIFQATNLIVLDLRYLERHKSNLKFVSLGRLAQGTFDKLLLQELSSNFGVVSVDDNNYGCLKMAVNRLMDWEPEVDSFQVSTMFF